jgi:hypothetical protein
LELPDRSSGWRSYYSNNYNDNIPFFIGLARRPKIEFSPARRVDLVGFRVTVRRNGIRHPSVECNEIEYPLEKQDHNSETVFLHVDTVYSFYPFAINQDHSVGAYIIQRTSRGVAPNNPNNDTTVLASFRISGEGFKIEKEYVLTTNLSQLRTRRLNPNELIPAGNVTVSLEEVKEPSLWRRFLSSFSVTRTRIPK